MDTFYVVIIASAFIFMAFWILSDQESLKIQSNYIEHLKEYTNSLENLHLSDEKVIKSQNNYINSLENVNKAQDSYIKGLCGYYGHLKDDLLVSDSYEEEFNEEKKE